MAQSVSAILSRQDELSARARRFTNDANEAGLLVGKVISRAFNTFHDGEDEDVILRSMQRDLDRMIETLRRTHR